MPPSTSSRSNSPILTHRPLTAAEAFGMGGGRDDFGDAGRRDRGMPGRYGAPGGGGGDASSAMPRRPNNGFAPGAPQGGPDAGRGWKKDLSESRARNLGRQMRGGEQRAAAAAIRP
ncbi:hypothetical protein L1887_46108 [Cichorium endivia]|nr:hypothetical protein L1887_46108 [Cichorium endivia]